jgi:hypothetical protein
VFVLCCVAVPPPLPTTAQVGGSNDAGGGGGEGRGAGEEGLTLRGGVGVAEGGDSICPPLLQG